MNSIKRHSMSLLLISFFTLFASNTFAKSQISTSFFSSTAVSGYDTVAYFTQNKPVKGNSKFSTKYQEQHGTLAARKTCSYLPNHPSNMPHNMAVIVLGPSLMMMLLSQIRKHGQSSMTNYT